MLYVFDASFVGAQIIPDEKDPHVEILYSKIKRDDEKHAPNLLWYEISNIFMNLIRRKRYSYDEILQFYPHLDAIRLKYDHETGIEYSKKLLRICNNYKLSSYDAAYLELAERKNAVLCTLDNDFQAVAKSYGVKVL